VSSRFSISAVFKAVDDLTRPTNRMTAGVKRSMRSLRADYANANRQVTQLARNVKTGLTTAMRTAATLGAAVLGAGIAYATREFVQFDNAITNASAKFKGLNLATAEGQAKLEELNASARKVGANTQFSATEAAQGLDFLAMAGFNADQAMASLPLTVDLATVANVDLARATDIASDSLGAFGLMTEDANQLQINFTRQNDVMAKTMASTNTSMEDLFDAIKKGAPTFTAAGQSLESFNALAGILANSGVKGAEAGTQLRNIMLRLANPTAQAADVLKNLGVQTQDEAGNFRDVIDILADFENGLKGMGTAQRAAALSTVFGTRAVTGVNLLLQSGTANLTKFRDELIGAGGASADMAGIIRQSLGNQLNILKSGLIELGFQFIEAFEQNGRGALSGLIEAVQNFDITPVINTMKTLGNIFGVVFNLVKTFGPIILGVVAAWKIYRTALLVAAAAQQILNIAMNASPLGIIITVVGLVIGAFAALALKMGGVKEAFIAIGQTIMKAFLTPINLAIDYFQLFIKLLGKLPGKAGQAFQGLNTNIDEMQANINQKLTGSAGAYDFGAAFKTGDNTQAPVTQGERAAFSSSKSVEQVDVSVKAEPGTSATMRRGNRRQQRNYAVKLQQSGGI
jgi:TP901 family phage tail tape measure protein